MPPRLVPRDRRIAVTPVVFVTACDARGSAFHERTHAVNASGSGLCFDTVHDLAVGTRVRLKVLIPIAWRGRFGSRALYPVRAVVRRIEPAPRPDHRRIGVELVGEDPGS
jgi:hypothetical protein